MGFSSEDWRFYDSLEFFLGDFDLFLPLESESLRLRDILIVVYVLY